MAADYRGLGFDPAPGSVAAVAAASDRIGRAASHAAGAQRVIGDAGTRMDRAWSGGAAASFTAALERALAELAGARRVLEAAAAVLDGWATTLRANQRRADRLDRQAVELRRAVEQAGEDLARARTALQVAIGSAARSAAADHAAALARHARLVEELDRVLAAARELEREHRTAASRVAERLRALGAISESSEVGSEVSSAEAGDLGRIATIAGSLALHGGELARTLFGPGAGSTGAVSMGAGSTGAVSMGAGSTGAVSMGAGSTGAVGRFVAALAGPPGGR